MVCNFFKYLFYSRSYLRNEVPGNISESGNYETLQDQIKVAILKEEENKMIEWIGRSHKKFTMKAFINKYYDKHLA